MNEPKDGGESAKVTGSSTSGSKPDHGAERSAGAQEQDPIMVSITVAGGIAPPVLVQVQWVDPATNKILVPDSYYIVEKDGGILLLATGSLEEAMHQFESYLQIASIGGARQSEIKRRLPGATQVKGIRLLIWRRGRLVMRQCIYTEAGEWVKNDYFEVDESGRANELPNHDEAVDLSAERGAKPSRHRLK